MDTPTAELFVPADAVDNVRAVLDSSGRVHGDFRPVDGSFLVTVDRRTVPDAVRAGAERNDRPRPQDNRLIPGLRVDYAVRLLTVLVTGVPGRVRPFTAEVARGMTAYERQIVEFTAGVGDRSDLTWQATFDMLDAWEQTQATITALRLMSDAAEDARR